MSTSGKYLYGFVAGDFKLTRELLGLADAPVHSIQLEDIAAIVSDHSVEKLSLLRKNVEPHHRVIREISAQSTLIPATFGHISDTKEQILAVLRDNHAAIGEELRRLSGKAEMGVKLVWDVDNIFDFFVGADR